MADIQSVIQENLDELVGTGEEVGLQAAVYLEGTLVADCVAGLTGRNSNVPVKPDTLFTVGSTSKGVISTAFHILAERGIFDYDKPVSHYWPEFGVAGKESITIKQVMNHVAGIPQTPVWPDVPALDYWIDHNRAIEETAKLEPLFAPGTTSCYHGLTIGWVLAGLVKQVDGRTLGQVVRDEIATPLGIRDELYLGTPASEHGRMAAVYDAPVNEEDLPAYDPESILSKVIPPMDESLGAITNYPSWRSAEIPAANISTTARALAKHYAATVSDVNGCRLITEDRLKLIFSHQTDLPDVFLNTQFGVPMYTPRILGYQKNTGREDQLFYYGPNLQAFGHDGYGGSEGFADPRLRLGFGYTKTLLHSYSKPDGGSKLRTMLPEEMSRTRITKALYNALK